MAEERACADRGTVVLNSGEGFFRFVEGGFVFGVEGRRFWGLWVFWVQVVVGRGFWILINV